MNLEVSFQFSNTLCRLMTVHDRYTHIHPDKMRSLFLPNLYTFLSIFRFPYVKAQVFTLPLGGQAGPPLHAMLPFLIFVNFTALLNK